MRAWREKSSLGKTKSFSSEARASPKMTAFKWEILPAPEGKEAMDSTCLKWLVVVRFLGEEDAMTNTSRVARPCDWQMTMPQFLIQKGTLITMKLLREENHGGDGHHHFLMYIFLKKLFLANSTQAASIFNHVDFLVLILKFKICCKILSKFAVCTYFKKYLGL